MQGSRKVLESDRPEWRILAPLWDLGQALNLSFLSKLLGPMVSRYIVSGTCPIESVYFFPSCH